MTVATSDASEVVTENIFHSADRDCSDNSGHQPLASNLSIQALDFWISVDLAVSWDIY